MLTPVVFAQSRFFTVAQDDNGYVWPEGHATRHDAERYAAHLVSLGWRVVVTKAERRQG